MKSMATLVVGLLYACTVLAQSKVTHVSSSEAKLANTGNAQSDIVIPAGEYELIANVVLPNLQDHLTGSETRQKRCLHQQPASDLFPLLKHPSFTGCTLKNGTSKKQANNNIKNYNFQLICINNDAATGTASILVEQGQFSAQLNVKMGAKNMTMTQNLVAKKISGCEQQ